MCFIDSYERVVNPMIVSCAIIVTKLIFDMVNKKNAKRETTQQQQQQQRAQKPRIRIVSST